MQIYEIFSNKKEKPSEKHKKSFVHPYKLSLCVHYMLDIMEMVSSSHIRYMV